MVSLAHILLYFPLPLIVLLVGFVVSSSLLFIKSPALRSYLLLGLVLLTLAPLINCSYSNPQKWWARHLAHSLMPSPKELGWRYIDKSGFDHGQQAIYIWYPHGHLGTSALGSVAYNLGAAIWKRPVALCVAPPFMDLPAIRQVSMGLGLVRSDELNMRDCLRQGTSLVVLPGGRSEVAVTRPNEMNLIDGRQGFLRLAATMNLPLIPVFAFGENEMFGSGEKIHFGFFEQLLRNWYGAFEGPSWGATLDWFRKPVRPLTIKFGAPLLPADFPKSLSRLATEWKEHVDLHYALLRTRGSPERIHWIKAGAGADIGAPSPKGKNSVTE